MNIIDSITKTKIIKYKCSNCEQEFDLADIKKIATKDDDTSTRIIDLCNTCLAENYFHCYVCDLYIDNSKESETYVEGHGSICEDCRDNGDVFWCEDCENYYDSNSDSLCRTTGDHIVCGSCADTNYYLCDHCNLYFQANEDGYHCNNCGDSYCTHCADNEYACDCDSEEDGESYFDDRNWIKTPCNYEKGNIVTFDRLVGCEIETEPTGSTPDYLNSLFSKDIGLSEDGSLDNGCEIVTPPLKGIRLEDTIKNVCRICNEQDLGVSSSCGLHIHIDLSDIRNDTTKIKHLLSTYFLIENVFYNALPSSRLNGTYSKPLTNKFTLKDIQGKGDIDLLWYLDKVEREYPLTYADKKQAKARIDNRKKNKCDSTRYTGFNLHSVFYRGTIELRYHSGTVNPTKILNWIQLNLAVIDWALNHYNKSKLMPIYSAPTREKVDLFCKLFKINKDLKAYLIDRTNKFGSWEDGNSSESEDS